MLYSLLLLYRRRRSSQFHKKYSSEFMWLLRPSSFKQVESVTNKTIVFCHWHCSQALSYDFSNLLLSYRHCCRKTQVACWLLQKNLWKVSQQLSTVMRSHLMSKSIFRLKIVCDWGTAFKVLISSWSVWSSMLQMLYINCRSLFSWLIDLLSSTLRSIWSTQGFFWMISLKCFLDLYLGYNYVW